jgi:2,4-dienoyl-CoA reductase-like NADH-dependent reductase (Old Yellow Enzyme family)
MSLLFQPISFGSLQLSNKIIIAPMCQYSAEQGYPSFWHAQQWASYALSGAGLVIVEATAVQAAGRISYADLGLWNDQQAEAIQAMLQQVRRLANIPFAVQLAHAGRKASTAKPWQGATQLPAEHALGWQSVAPSELAFYPDQQVPHALSLAEIAALQADFASAAQRAVAAGFDLIEIHAAHGYLLHQFLSPLSNQRQDQYGGGFEQRIRMLLETTAAILAAVPAGYPVGIRLSAQDWREGGWSLAETVRLSQRLEQLGVAYLHISSGGLDAQQQIEIKANYQVPFAEAVKQAVSIPVIAVGLITTAQQAEAILLAQQADAIAIARSQLYNPRWAWHAAADLAETIAVAPQYLRCQPHQLATLFKPF